MNCNELVEALQAVLRGYVSDADPVRLNGRWEPVGTLVRAVGGGALAADKLAEVMCVPEVVRDAAGQTRGVYPYFSAACAARAFGLLRSGLGAENEAVCGQRLRESIRPMVARGGELAAGKGRVIERLWVCWVMMLLEQELEVTAERGIVERLWRGAMAEQDGEGRWHRQDVETNLDAFVYDEFTAIHAAANVGIAAGNAELLKAVRRSVRYHVENTQPDNTTNQPWGLAGFAWFDEGREFAAQQVHDVRTWLANRGRTAGADGGVPLVEGLIADAIVTLSRS